MNDKAIPEGWEGPRGYPPYGSSKQTLGEWEVQGVGSLSGAHHLHFLFQKGRWEWVLRSNPSALCKTARCRMVTVTEQEAP